VSEGLVGERADVAQQTVGSLLSGKQALGRDAALRIATKTKLLIVREIYELAPEVQRWEPTKEAMDGLRNDELRAALSDPTVTMTEDLEDATDLEEALAGATTAMGEETKRRALDLIREMIEFREMKFDEARRAVRAVVALYDGDISNVPMKDLALLAWTLMSTDEFLRENRVVPRHERPSAAVLKLKTRQ
jgi:hypothetical protein